MCASSNNRAAAGCCTGAERAVAVVVILVACVLGLQHGAHAMPKAMPPVSSFGFLSKPKTAGEEVVSVISEDNECYHNAEVETLCQRCAKLTKSTVVYPMCCEDKEDAREWCDLYLNYGIQSAPT